MKSLIFEFVRARRRRLALFRTRPVTAALVLLALVALLPSRHVQAEVLPVAAVRVVEQDSYRIRRVYAGELHPVRQSQLGFEFGGAVATVTADEGDRIGKGDVLARLEASTMEASLESAIARLETARANVVAHAAQMALSAATLARYRELVERDHGSEQRLDELEMQHRVDAAREGVLRGELDSALAQVEQARANLNKYTLRAPYNGIVQSRMVDEGSIVSPGQSILSVVEDGKLEAQVGIPENMVRHLHDGTSYDLDVRGRQVSARLARILPVADSQTGTVTAIFETEGNGMFAGTLAEITLSVEVQRPGFWVPVAALSESQRGLWSVLVVDDNADRQFVEARLVEILYRGRDRVFVQGTLDDGDLVVAGGTSRIVPGQDVNVASIDGMTPVR